MSTAMKKTVHDERLICGVLSLDYDFATREGRIYFPAGDCCDMKGCIALFRGIDPGVRGIETFSGGSPDTAYCIDDWGRWVAFAKGRRSAS